VIYVNIRFHDVNAAAAAGSAAEIGKKICICANNNKREKALSLCMSANGIKFIFIYAWGGGTRR
jgi:hypothetical protein